MATISRYIAVTLVLVAASACAARAGEHVVTLGASNFDSEIQKHDFTLVEFYAPWCGHCKKLAPEYEKAAKILKDEGSDIVLAKVDADNKENKALAKKFDIKGFPTLKIFRKDSGIEDYDGPREAAGIVSAVKKLAGPPTRELLTAADAKELMESSSVSVVGVFEDFESKEFKSFTAVASALRSGLSFGHTKDPSILPDNGTPLVAPTVRLYKDFDEGFNDITVFEEEPLKEALETKSVPLVVEMSRDESAMKVLMKVFQSPKSKALLFLDYNSPEKKTYQEAYHELAKAGKNNVNFIIGDGKENDHALKYFAVSIEDLPVLLIHDTSEDKKYVKTGVQPSELESFVDDFEKGKLEPQVKSQPIPESNDEPVKVVVYKNFDDIVFKSGKNVLLEFYAPWCGHCKQLAPIYEEVGEEFEDEDDVIIAKMDADGNDVPSNKFNVKGFPTLYFINAQGVVKEYKGERTKADLISYVNKFKTTPSPPPSPVSETAEAVAEAAEAAAEKAAEGIQESVDPAVKDEL